MAMEAAGTAAPGVWTVDYDNDSGPGDEGLTEWWNVVGQGRRFRCHDEDSARWLAEVLSARSRTVG